MENGYKLLFSAFREIEAERIKGILELEGIRSYYQEENCSNLKNYFVGGSPCFRIYVTEENYERAAEVLETEMVRGDF